MIYIPEVKKRIEELKDRWERNELTTKELKEFNALIDDVIREARKSISSYLTKKSGPALLGKDGEIFQEEKHNPELYLLALLKKRIENVLLRFFNKNKLLEEATEITKKGKPVDIRQTLYFKEWLLVANSIVLMAILGDSTEREDREKIVCEHATAFMEDEQRFFEMINTDIAQDVKRILQDANTKDYPEHNFLPWAISIATQEGRDPVKGSLTYDPDYVEHRSRELKFDLASLRMDIKYLEKEYDLYKRQKHPRQKELKTMKKFEDWLRDTRGHTREELPFKIEAIRNELKTMKDRAPNFCDYIFGKKTSRWPFLESRLGEILRLRRQKEGRGPIYMSDEDLDAQEHRTAKRGPARFNDNGWS